MNLTYNNKMQLVIISAIEAYRTPIISLLNKIPIPSFTIHEAIGYKDISSDHVSDNWFGSELNEMPSVVFHIYTTEDFVLSIKDKIDEMNDSLVYESKIHIVSCPIIQYNF